MARAASADSTELSASTLAARKAQAASKAGHNVCRDTCSGPGSDDHHSPTGLASSKAFKHSLSGLSTEGKPPATRGRIHLGLLSSNLRGASWSERPQTRKRNHPRPRLMETSHINKVKTPQHDGTPRARSCHSTSSN